MGLWFLLVATVVSYTKRKLRKELVYIHIRANFGEPVPFPHRHFSTGIHFNISMLFSASNNTCYHQQGELFSYLLNIFVF